MANLYPQFLTKYGKQSTEAGATAMFLRFLVGATGAITSFSHMGAGHILSVVRLKAGYYGVYLDGVFYVTRNPNLSIYATPLMSASEPQVFGPLAPTTGTNGQVVNDQSAAQGQRLIPWLTADAVVAGTNTFTIGNGAFTAADVGAPFIVTGSANGNDKTYHIATVTNATTIVTVEAPAANETFASTVKYAIAGAFIVIAFSQLTTPGAADVQSGSEVAWDFHLKTEAP
jgi:hypothetical protein